MKLHKELYTLIEQGMPDTTKELASLKKRKIELGEDVKNAENEIHSNKKEIESFEERMISPDKRVQVLWGAKKEDCIDTVEEDLIQKLDLDDFISRHGKHTGPGRVDYHYYDGDRIPSAYANGEHPILYLRYRVEFLKWKIKNPTKYGLNDEDIDSLQKDIELSSKKIEEIKLKKKSHIETQKKCEKEIARLKKNIQNKEKEIKAKKEKSLETYAEIAKKEDELNNMPLEIVEVRKKLIKKIDDITYSESDDNVIISLLLIREIIDSMNKLEIKMNAIESSINNLQIIVNQY